MLLQDQVFPRSRVLVGYVLQQLPSPRSKSCGTRGYAIAAHQLGKCYRDGVGVQRDDAKAAERFRRSAVQGSDCSEYALGKLLRRGH